MSARTTSNAGLISTVTRRSAKIVNVPAMRTVRPLKGSCTFVLMAATVYLWKAVLMTAGVLRIIPGKLINFHRHCF